MSEEKDRKELPEKDQKPEAAVNPPMAEKPEKAKKRTKPVNERGRTPFGRFLRNYGYLFVTVFVMLALFRGIFLLGFVTSGSMETTLPTHSVFLSWHLSYALGNPAPERGDIVLFDSDELGQTLVKRVVGLPGETVSFRDGYVLINGAELEERYLPVQGITYSRGEDDSFTVPEDCVFLLGDHRDDSLDSRFWQDPFVPASNIRARALAVVSLWPGNTWLGVRRVG